MPYKSQDTYKRLLEKKLRSNGKKETWEKWAKHIRKIGPIKMVEELKLTVKGQPITLSEDQKYFLTDLWVNGVRFAIVVAGRGAGKTLILAIYTLWLLISYDVGDVSAMGGSEEQSMKIQGYITEWERLNPYIKKSIISNTKGRPAKIVVRNYNEVLFMSCSATSVRGPHTVKLFLDEVCAGEERGNIEQIKAAFGEVSTSPDIGVIMTSTAHWVFGLFREILDNPEEYGFKAYRWSIAEHESGVTDPYLIYKFKTGWKPKVPWVTQEALDFLRKMQTNEEWLVEVLGGVATMSGSVINPEDMKIAVCDECDECNPYMFPECKLVTKKELKRITERYIGVDWGDVAPNAWTVVGRLKEHVYVLYNNELVGLRDVEALEFTEKIMDTWKVEVALPDPSQYPMNNALSDKGLTVHKLFTKYGGQAKDMYVRNVKRHFEKGKIHIPKAYEKLIKSIRQLTYDKKGKIRKINDHSWDSLIYGMAEYYEDIQKIYEMSQKKRMIDLW